MIKILKEGTIKKITCEKCGCYFSYEQEDVKEIVSKNSGSFVLCPQCGERVYLMLTRGLEDGEN